MQDTITIGDITVRRLGLGAMHLTGYRPAADRSEPIRVARRAVELGVQFIDTADTYGLGANEELLAEALHPYGGLLIATKVGRTLPSPGEWGQVGRPEYLRQAAELSLRRLRVDRIDLLQLHKPDPKVPFADQVGALRRLRDEGKVRYVGLSNVTVAQLEEARSIVEIMSVQNQYNLGDRRNEGVLDHCEREGIAFLPWLPLVRTPRPVLTEVAAELDATPAQVSLAWLLHRSPVMAPIPGTSSTTHLEQNVAAADLKLSAEQITRLGEAGKVAA
jgi:aryl-alcohol dehydrogenase-like predicted oxidoreductase